MFKAVFLFSCVFLTACSSEQKKKEKLKSRCRTERILISKLDEKESETDRCTIDVNLEYCYPGESNYSATVNDLIRKELVRAGKLFTENIHTPNELNSKEVNHWMQALDVEKAKQQTTGATDTWWLVLKSKVDCRESAFIQLVIEKEYKKESQYINKEKYCFVVDRTTGKQLKPADIFVDIQQLNNTGESFFRIQQGIPKKENLADKYWFEKGVFYCPDNFFYDKDGISFIYQPYEIAPLSSGIIQFTIPYKVLRDNLLIQKEH